MQAGERRTASSVWGDDGWGWKWWRGEVRWRRGRQHGWVCDHRRVQRSWWAAAASWWPVRCAQGHGVGRKREMTVGPRVRERREWGISRGNFVYKKYSRLQVGLKALKYVESGMVRATREL